MFVTLFKLQGDAELSSKAGIIANVVISDEGVWVRSVRVGSGNQSRKKREYNAYSLDMELHKT